MSEAVVITAGQLRASVVARARAWLGTPYHHQGRVLGAGVDCAGLLCEVYREVGLMPEIDAGNYPCDWHLHRGEELILAWADRFAVPVQGEPLPGDAVLFKFGRTFSHACIVVSWPWVIHAERRNGCVLLADVSQGDCAQREFRAYTFAQLQEGAP